MQYCPNCMVQIRGHKARCPLCQRELMEAERIGALTDDPEQETSTSGQEYDDDPFVRLPEPRISFMLMIRMVTFVCVSLEILLGAAEVISGFSSGWIVAVMLFVLLGWADFQIAVYYRNNIIRMLTIQGYIIMIFCLIICQVTGTGRWAITWVVPGMFIALIAATFLAALAQGMELHEYILYPAFDVLMSLLQIIPAASGYNPNVAPAVICIALMLILVSSLIIFRGRMLREAAEKYLHM